MLAALVIKMIYAMVWDETKEDILTSQFFKGKEQALNWFDQICSRKPFSSGMYLLSLYQEDERKPFYEEERF